jgi:DNA (cytosine-5)-methyltransferase 1
MIEYSKLLDWNNRTINWQDADHIAELTHFLQNIGHESAQHFTHNIPDIINQLNIEELFSTGSSTYSGNNLHLELDYDVPFPPNEDPDFTFIDLFAGIGGFRLALQSLGGKCVFTSEIDKYCKKVYNANYGEVPFGDIKSFTSEHISDELLDNLIPNHNILAAGFPCQAFSIAGKRGGFNDTRGTLFFDVARILNVKRPQAFILENVKGLVSHKRGQTLETILNVLRNDLGYFVPDPQVLNAKNFGVPQKRERIIIVGFRADTEVNDYIYPETHLEDSIFVTGTTFQDAMEKKPVSPKYYLSDVYLETLENHKERHSEKGNGFGYQIVEKDETANAIVVGGMGRERNLVIDFRQKKLIPETNIKGEINKVGIRKMTPREWARLQGFPNNFIIDVVSDTQSYKQFGNSVAVPVIQAVGKTVINKLY